MYSIRIYHSSSDIICQEWLKCTSNDISKVLSGYCYQYYRWYPLSTNASIGDSFICSTEMGISNTISLIFWQYSIQILLWSGALVNSVNNTTVPERVKTRTVVLQDKYCYSVYSLTSCHCKLVFAISQQQSFC